MAFDQQKYIAEYNKQNYCQISILLPRGCKRDIDEMANDYGVSSTEFALRAVESKYKIVLRSKEVQS